MNAQEYAKYRESPAWRLRKQECFKRFDYRCQICGCTSWRRFVDVHHLHYRNVGQEAPEDLAPLCVLCHKLIHEQKDGYDWTVIERMRRDCADDFWGDPNPAFMRDKPVAALPVDCPQCFEQNESNATNCSLCGSRLFSEPIAIEQKASWEPVNKIFTRKHVL